MTLTDSEKIVKRARETRAMDKLSGLPVFMSIRYADNFIILVATRDSNAESAQATADSRNRLWPR